MSRAAFALGALVLTGCASQATVNGALPAVANADVAFEVSGRIAVRYNGQADSGNFTWQHGIGQDRLALETPLGQTLAELNRDPAGVRLDMADGRRFRAAAVESLSAEVLGWELPLSGLQYWIRGVGSAASGIDASQISPEPGVYRLSQQGWQIDYPEFSGPPAVPSRVVLKRPGLEIRLAIHEWKFVP